MSDEGALSIERTHLAGVVEDAKGTPMRLKGDETSGSMRVNLWTWDTGTTAYVRQTFMDMAALTTAIGTLTTAIDALTAAIEAM